jgi:hypothetical protein
MVTFSITPDGLGVSVVVSHLLLVGGALTTVGAVVGLGLLDGVAQASCTRTTIKMTPRIVRVLFFILSSPSEYLQGLYDFIGQDSMLNGICRGVVRGEAISGQLSAISEQLSANGQ